ncbi:asparagine synthase-related protein [bacterium]|nr:asparagine synthase-related protein [bacterium]
MNSDLDRFLYDGFKKQGGAFLCNLQGRYGAAYHDQEQGIVFLCRDWVGEVPLHYQLTDDSLVVANYISDIKSHLGPSLYRYDYVRAVPHSHALIVDAKEQYEFGKRIKKKWTVRERLLFYDFAKDVREWTSVHEDLGIEQIKQGIRESLERSVERRLASSASPRALLLSGGIDSLTIAYVASQLDPNMVVFTLSVDGGGDDVRRAKEISSHFGLEFRVVEVTAHDIAREYSDAVKSCELYHIPNTYCAVGMRLIGKALRRDGFKVAFCGEGVNEALGDYHDWVVKDPVTGQPLMLQRVDDVQLGQTPERIRYVWGQARPEGRYNLQLGSGLGKHGIGRMVKPLLELGIELECPYLDHNVMKWLVSIPKKTLDEMGGKPGLMAKVFAKEIENGRINAPFILESQKIRLQDASELGAGGISPVLLKEGYDQQRTIEIFNELFGARLNPQLDSERLSLCSA